MERESSCRDKQLHFIDTDGTSQSKPLQRGGDFVLEPAVKTETKLTVLKQDKVKWLANETKLLRILHLAFFEGGYNLKLHPSL